MAGFADTVYELIRDAGIDDVVVGEIPEFLESSSRFYIYCRWFNVAVNQGELYNVWNIQVHCSPSAYDLDEDMIADKAMELTRLIDRKYPIQSSGRADSAVARVAVLTVRDDASY